MVPGLVVHQLEADGARLRMRRRQAAEIAVPSWRKPRGVEKIDGSTITSKFGTRVAPWPQMVVSVTRKSSSYAVIDEWSLRRSTSQPEPLR